MAVAWPYAAMYDPYLATSLLQAAAAAIPLHNPAGPPLYATHPYHPRYGPYPNFTMAPHQTSQPIPIPNPALALNQNVPLGPHQTFPQYHQLPQGLNLNLGLDFPTYHAKVDQHQRMSPVQTASPIHSEISLSPPAPAPGEGLLMTAKVSPPARPTTRLLEKPKLFKPYKTEF